MVMRIPEPSTVREQTTQDYLRSLLRVLNYILQDLEESIKNIDGGSA